MPEISVAIYVQSYVPHLMEKSIASVAEQSFSSTEIILVDDCRTNSESRSVKSSFKKISKSLKLSYGKSIRFLSMGQSVGISDSLRAAAEDASGKYFSVLISGDGFYSETALSSLMETAEKNPLPKNDDWDLIQGTVVPEKKDPMILEKNPKAYDIIEKNAPGTLVCSECDSFAEKYILSGNYSLCVPGKLFLRSTLVSALEKMPRLSCFTGIEYLWMYFFCRSARTLISADKTVCVKNMETSPDAGDFKIENPGRWVRICSASSAFSAIFFDLMDRPMKSLELSDYLRSVMTRYALSNVRAMARVDDSIKTVARAVLDECWGEEIINQCIEWLEKA